MVAERDPQREPTHPGTFLNAVVIPGTRKTKVEIAHLLGISRQTLHDILSTKSPMTPEMAVRFGKLFGNGAVLWANMQSSYDLWHAERKVDTASIPTLEVA